MLYDAGAYPGGSACHKHRAGAQARISCKLIGHDQIPFLRSDSIFRTRQGRAARLKPICPCQPLQLLALIFAFGACRALEPAACDAPAARLSRSLQRRTVSDRLPPITFAAMIIQSLLISP